MLVEKINSISAKITTALHIPIKQPLAGTENKELTNASKVMLGATALTAVSIAGIAIAVSKGNAKKAQDAAENLKKAAHDVVKTVQKTTDDINVKTIKPELRTSMMTTSIDGHRVKTEEVYRDNVVIETYAPDGKVIKNHFTGIEFKDIKAAEELDAKYAALSDMQLRIAYDAAAPGMPELEYKILKKQMDRMATLPDASIPQLEAHYKLCNKRILLEEFLAGNGPKNPYYLKHMQKYIDELDKKWKKLPPLEKDYTFWRNVNKTQAAVFANAKTGDIVVPDEGYLYAAFHRQLADSYCEGSVSCEIRVPKGTKISADTTGAFMPRGAQYKLISQKTDPLGQLNVMLEYHQG
jgi:hypothetical protein